ncbi:MAG: DUF3604 domain-containing protein [Pseudomonadales bacterium]
MNARATKSNVTLHKDASRRLASSFPEIAFLDKSWGQVLGSACVLLCDMSAFLKTTFSKSGSGNRQEPISEHKIAAILAAVMMSSQLFASEQKSHFGPAAKPNFPVAEQQPCRDRSEQRNAYFGATHIHTTLSFDSQAFGVTSRPDDAYAFARGEPISLPPLNKDGKSSRQQQLARPLDFAAVTDHAEYLGEVVRCTTPGNSGYDSKACKGFRGEELGEWPPHLSHIARLFSLALKGKAEPRNEAVCGKDGLGCLNAMVGPWQEIQQSAEKWDDASSECEFTTFVAYEYSLANDSNNLHRNVIFKNAIVPPLPISARDAEIPLKLWQSLSENCLESGTGCDVLAIPHNSNWSAGHMFYSEYPGATSEAEQASIAQLRQTMEPLVEIMQVKGDSECRNGLYDVIGSADELCDFEKLRAPAKPVVDCELGTGVGGMRLNSCMSRLSFARYALIEGLKEKQRLGVNPLKFGIIAASDNHNATGGAVAEASFAGASGRDARPQDRLGGEIKVGNVATSSAVRTNPGGIAGIWAEENNRASLFEAMKRRETFGTSGPRITPRFFASWNLPKDMCEQSNFAEIGYANGVPMGADLPARKNSDSKAPSFALNALRDSSNEGAPLQRLQIVKGWHDDKGRMHQDIYDVAGSANNGASVDTQSCERKGPGNARLCTVWTDPDFDQNRDAVYYARVVENPSCRWSTYQCNSIAETDRPETCRDPNVPKTIQERAWTSPIWYSKVQ